MVFVIIFLILNRIMFLLWLVANIFTKWCSTDSSLVNSSHQSLNQLIQTTAKKKTITKKNITMSSFKHKRE